MNGQTVIAVLDSGSSRSILIDKTMKRLGLLQSASSAHLLAANGQPLRVLGEVDVEILVDGHAFTQNFVIIPDLGNDDALLGDDFLSASNAVISWAANSFEVYGDKQLKVYSTGLQVVPPLARKFVTVRIEHPPGQSAHKCYEVTGTESLYHRRLLCMHPGVIKGKDTFSVLLVNSSLRPAVLPERSSVGVAEEVQGVEEVVLDDNETGSILQATARTVEEERVKATVAGSTTVPVDINGITFNMGASLSGQEKERATKLISENLASFGRHATDLGNCAVQYHSIKTGSSSPISQRPTRLSPAQRDLVKAMITDLLKAGIVKPSRSPWASPLVLVEKKDGSTRMCVDYRKLNSVTESDVYPLPRIDDALAALSGSRYFSTVDLLSGFHQIQMNPDDTPKTAFVTQWGLYEYLRMPFGLKGAPATCRRTVDNVIADAKYRSALAYMDDCVVYSKTFEEHVADLGEVFKRFSEASLKFKPQKCFFFCLAVAYLGHIVSEEGISPDPGKLEAVSKFPAPQNVTELQSFLGLTSYFRKFIPNHSITAAPLRKLLKKDTPFQWNLEQEEAFEALKSALCEPPVLKHFSEGEQFAIQVRTDASRLGLGAILVQQDSRGEYRPVVYLSRSLRPAEESYSLTELEALAVKWALEQLRPYLMGRKFQVVTDHHALCWLLRYMEGNQRLLRWSLILQEFDFDVVYKSGTSHAGPDCLSRTLSSSIEPREVILAISCQVLQVDPADISAEQKADDFCARTGSILEGREGTGKQQKRTRNRFIVFDGVLYKKECKVTQQRFLLCLPKTQRSKVLNVFHAGMYGGHMGIRRTFDRVREKFFWPKLYVDVKRYVQSCDLCQRMNVTSTALYGLLQPIAVDTAFHTVGLDVIGPLHPSRPCKYVIVAIDCLTKYVEAKAVCNTEALTVHRFIERRLVLKHGCPATIITDRGTQMMARSTEKYLEHRGIRHATACNPADNGQVERANETIKQMIRLLTTTGDKWPDVLPYVVFCYNTGRQDTTEQTPFYLVYGRDAILPLDVVYSRKQLAELREASDYAALVRESLTKARQLAAKYIKVAQEKQKRLFDKHRIDVCFEKDQLVLLRPPPVGLKEKTTCEGPHRIVSRLSPVNYEIEFGDGSGRHIVHLERLKPYVPPLAELTQQ